MEPRPPWCAQLYTPCQRPGSCQNHLHMVPACLHWMMVFVPLQLKGWQERGQDDKTERCVLLVAWTNGWTGTCTTRTMTPRWGKGGDSDDVIFRSFFCH